MNVTNKKHNGYKCSGCFRLFRDEEHVHELGRSRLEEPPQDGYFRCPFCFEKLHSDIIYECGCGRLTTKKDSFLFEHIESKQREFMCIVCERDFDNKKPGWTKDFNKLDEVEGEWE